MIFLILLFCTIITIIALYFLDKNYRKNIRKKEEYNKIFNISNFNVIDYTEKVPFFQFK